MDSSTFTSENESLSEVEILKQQLNTYKMINADLSKKIQELKVELNAFKHENAIIKREVLEERAKAVECRQHFQTMNRHCINFINTYVNTMQAISENDESLIEGIPGIDKTPRNDNNKENPEDITIVPKVERRPTQHTIRSQLHGALHEEEDPGCNLLNTILEESIPIYTSTPIVPTRNGVPNSTPKVVSSNSSPQTPMQPENMFITPVNKNSDNEIPIIQQNMFKSPRNGNFEPKPQNSLNSSSSSNGSPNDIDSPINRTVDPAQQASNLSSTVTETPKLQVTSSTRRFSIIPDDEIEEYPDKQNETAGDDTTQQTLHHETIKEVKVCRVALSPLKMSQLQNNNNTNTESPEYESCDDDVTMAISHASSNTSKSLKRKSSETGRPRRQARPDANALKEPSLRTKLRRSRRKV